VPDTLRASVLIRDATLEDWDAIWPFFHQIVAAGETYAYERDTDEAKGRRMWMIGPPGRTVVATDLSTAPCSGPQTCTPTGRITRRLGELHRRPVRPAARTGRALGEHVIESAGKSGFRAIQFNAVVETNEAAVKLWRSLGFEVLTTVPKAFDRPTNGYVGLLIMHRFV
jgi:GNAT superfamily N-acetyltransferase